MMIVFLDFDGVFFNLEKEGFQKKTSKFRN